MSRWRLLSLLLLCGPCPHRTVFAQTVAGQNVPAQPVTAQPVTAQPVTAQPVPAQDTVARIRASGLLRCAVDLEPEEWTSEDLHGPRVRFDLQLCRAVAVGIAGTGARVVAVPVNDEDEAVAALREGRADMAGTLSTSGAWTGVRVGPPVLEDGTGLLVPIATGAARKLVGARVCYLEGSATGAVLRGWFGARRWDWLPFPFSEEGEMQAALLSGNCAAVAGDVTRLERVRGQVGARRYRILPERLGDDPLAPAWRAGEVSFGEFVKAVASSPAFAVSSMTPLHAEPHAAR